MTEGPDPRGLEKVLLPSERLVIGTRRSPVVLAKPVGILVLAVALAIWIDLNIRSGGGGLVRLGWYLALGAAAWALWHLLEWRHERFAVTDKRVLLLHGFLTRKVAMMPIQKVTDLTYERPLLGYPLRYCTFVIENAGQDQALSRIDFVPHPKDNYDRLAALIFGDDHLVDEEDEESPHPHPAHEPVRVDRAQPTAVRTPSIYRSADLVRRDRTEDTGELPPYDPGRYT